MIQAQRIAVKALIYHEGKLLVLREAHTYSQGKNIGKYGVPGGRVEIGETWQEALYREVQEECGLKIEIGKPIEVGEWRPVIRNIPTQIIGVFFQCKPLSNEIVLSDDHDHYEWISAENMREIEIMSPENVILEKFFQLMREGIVTSS